jgi:uncharacterized protein (DUF58 family)
MFRPSLLITSNWIRSVASYDFSPRYSATIRKYLYHPFGILCLASLFSLLCGLFLHSQGFVLSGSLLAVIALGVIWPWLSLRGLDGLIRFEKQRGTEGESIEMQLRLTNRLPIAAFGLRVKEADLLAGISSLSRFRTSLYRWNLIPECRGIYPKHQPQISTGFPFGLIEKSRNLAIESTLIVWPKTFPVGPIPPVSGSHQVEGNVSRSKVGTNGDFLGVRPYRRGDSPKRIHWGQSARHDRLVVCELESNSRPVIQLVLDTDPHVHTGIGKNASLEWAIRIAASFAKGWLADGAQVGFAWAGGEIAPASGQLQLHQILDALAGLENSEARPVDEILACPHCRAFRDGLQVVITTDRCHAHGGCGVCEAEDQRWVVLKSTGFSESQNHETCGECPTAWLTIESPHAIPEQLKGGWREAKHGS